eukprot:14090891-Heterocapsa_arctica.AAC.1
MEYGRLEGHIGEKRTVMEIVYYVEQRMLESIIYGGNVKRLTINQISDTSSLFKLGIKNRINQNVSGIQE